MGSGKQGMKREVGLISLTFVGVSGVIGSGWLFAPMLAAQMAGPASLVAWGLGGIAIMLLALSFAEISAMLPVSGGIARVPHFSHGNVVSTAMGWSAWIGYNTTAPIEVEAMLSYLAPHIPGLYTDGTMEHLSTVGIISAAATLLLFTVLNLYGVRLFARLNASITWFKIAIPLVVSAVLLFDRFEISNFTAVGGFSPMGLHGILASISSGGIIFAYIGFRHTIDMAGEAKNPQVTVPLAIIFSLVICFLIYGALQLAFIAAMPQSALDNGWSNIHFSGDFGPVSGLATAVGLLWLVSILNIGAVISPLGGGLVAVGSMGRLALALSQNGFFPKLFQKLNRYSVPATALFFNFLVSTSVFVLLPFDQVVSLNGAAIILSFVAGPVAVAALRNIDPDRKRSFRLPLLVITGPAAFVVATLIIYWSGWNTFTQLGGCLFVGGVLFVLRMWKTGIDEMDLKEAVWLAPYLIGLGLLSYLGTFGGGIGVLPFGWDLLVISLFSIGIFYLAVRGCLSPEKYQSYLNDEDMGF